MMSVSYFLLVFLCVTFCKIDARSIPLDEPDTETVLAQRLIENQQLAVTVANYRHRFEHSPNFKAFRWALRELLTPPDCEICYWLLPVVS